MSDRSRRKLGAQAAKHLEPGTGIREVVVGRGHARMTAPAAIVLGVFGVAFVVALALGYVLIPGALVLILVVNSVRPPRVIVLADQGVAVLSRSALTSRPSKVLARLPLSVLPGPGSQGGSRLEPLRMGEDRVTFSTKERQRLVASMHQVTARR